MRILLARSTTSPGGSSTATLFDSTAYTRDIDMSFADNIVVFVRVNQASATGGLKVLTKVKDGAAFSVESSGGVNTVPAGTASVPHHTYVVNVYAHSVQVTYETGTNPTVYEVEVYAEFDGNAYDIRELTGNGLDQIGINLPAQ